jgi:hypothetical protein
MTKPRSRNEQKGLALQEHGWLLAGAIVPGCAPAPTGLVPTRTRGGCRQTVSEIDDDEAEEQQPSEEEDPVEEPVAEEAALKAVKPSNTRVLLEVDQLQKIFEKVGCPQCGGSLSLSL